MKKLIAMVLVCTCVCFCGCGGGKKSEQDTLRVCVGSDTESMDPAKIMSHHGGIYAQSIFEGLTRIGKEGLPVLAAAEKCDVSKDNMVYTFKLRDNTWHNGDKVRAQDYEYAWKRVLNPKTASIYAYMLYMVKNAEAYNNGKCEADAVGVKALDDKTIQVTLNAPTPYFLTICAHQTSFPVNPKVVESNPGWATKAETLIGNGPFKIDKWVRNNKMVMMKNEKHWDANNVKLKTLQFYLLEGGTTGKDMFDNGEIDFIMGAGKGRRERLQKEGKLHTHANLHLTHYAVDNQKAPFNDARVRRAFALVLDRKKISYVLTDKGPDTSGYGIVPRGIINTATGKDFREEGGNLFEENVEEAKKLMKEAGYEDISTFPTITLLYNNSESNKEGAELIQEMVKKHLGINIELCNQEWKVYIHNKKTRKYHLAQSYWIGDYSDPMTFLDLFVTGGGNNDAGYSNPKYDALVAYARNTGDQKLRMEAMHKAEKIIMEDMGTVPVGFGISYVSRDPRVKGYTFNGTALYDFRHAYKES